MGKKLGKCLSLEAAKPPMYRPSVRTTCVCVLKSSSFVIIIPLWSKNHPFDYKSRPKISTGVVSRSTINFTFVTF